MTFNDRTVLALVDTGSSACFLRQDAYEQITGLLKLLGRSILLFGIGISEVWAQIF